MPKARFPYTERILELMTENPDLRALDIYDLAVKEYPGIKKRTVWHMFNRHGRLSSGDPQYLKVLSMLDGGAQSDDEIASAVGVTDSYVRMLRRTSGFKRLKITLPERAFARLSKEAKSRELPVEETAAKILLEVLTKQNST